MKSMNLANLRKHYDQATAEAILELTQNGSIDRPKVSTGEKYLYIDTRILRAPYGVISMHEVKAACEANLSGAAWGVYCYLLTCMSGRISLKGTEIGGKQIMNATGYSKPTVYRACDALIKAKLIKASNASMNRRAWLLCNPDSDEIQDQATEAALQTAGNEATIKQQVANHNRSVNNPVNNPIDRLNTETENTSIVIKSDTNINYDNSNSNILIGGIKDQNQGYSKRVEYELITSYLSQVFSEGAQALESANQQDNHDTYTWLHESYETSNRLYQSSLEQNGTFHKETLNYQNMISHYEYEMKIFEFKYQRNIAAIWQDYSFKIADDLLNRRTNKTCRLRHMGWSGTQSLKKVAEYVRKFAIERLREYPTTNPYPLITDHTQETQ